MIIWPQFVADVETAYWNHSKTQSTYYSSKGSKCCGPCVAFKSKLCIFYDCFLAFLFNIAQWLMKDTFDKCVSHPPLSRRICISISYLLLVYYFDFSLPKIQPHPFNVTFMSADRVLHWYYTSIRCAFFWINNKKCCIFTTLDQAFNWY